MSVEGSPPPPGGRKGLVVLVALIVGIAIAIFVGFNLYHAKTQDTPTGPKGAVEGPPGRSQP